MEKGVEVDFAINDPVEVKAPGVRLGHRGRVVNLFSRSRPLYAVQFPDGCIGYFERGELGKAPPKGTAADRERGRGFQDTAYLETRPF